MVRYRRIRRLGLALGILFVVLGAAYMYVTRPSNLRAIVARVCARLNADVTIGEVAFAPSGSFFVGDLQLALRSTGEEASPARPTLRVDALRVDCNPWLLLLGSFHPTRIEARGANVVLVRDRSSDDRDDATGGWPDPERLRPWVEWLAGGDLARRPPFYASSVQLECRIFDDGRQHLVRRWLLDVTGHVQTIDNQPAYQIDLRQTGGTVRRFPGNGSTVSSLSARFLMQPGRVEISGLSCDAESLQQLAPRSIGDVMADCSAEGHFTLDRALMNLRGLQSVEVRGVGISLDVPVEGAEVPAEQRFLSIESGDVRLSATPEGLIAWADGKCRGAPVRVRLEARRAHERQAAASDSRSGMALGGSAGLSAVGPAPRRSEYIYDAHFQATGLPFPTREEFPRFVDARALPEPIRSFLKNYAPGGRSDVDLQVRGELMTERIAGARTRVQHDSPTVEGYLEVRDGTCRYHRFPYEIVGVQGRLRFAGGSIFLDGMTGRHGSGVVRADGRVFRTDSWSGFDLRFQTVQTPLDAHLFEALPARYQKLWSAASPVGVADLDIHLWRPDGTPETGPAPVDVEIEAELLHASLLAGSRRLTDAHGTLHISSGAVENLAILGRWQGADLRLDGGVELDPAGALMPVLRVTAAHTPLELELKMPFGDAGSTLSFRGRGNLQAWVENRDGLLQPGDLTVHVSDGVLDSFAEGKPWRAARGNIMADAQSLHIQRFEATAEDARIAISGLMGRTPGSRSELRVHCTADDLSGLVERLVPSRWIETARSMRATGPGAAELSLIAGEQGAVVSAKIQASAVRPDFFPLAVSDVAGQLEFSKSGVRIHGFTGTRGGGAVELSGHWGTSEERPSELLVQGSNLALDAGVLDALPAALAGPLRNIELAGQVSVNNLRLVRSPAGEWRANGAWILEQGEASIGMPLRDVRAQLTGDFRFTTGGPAELNGELAIHSALLGGRLVEKLDAVVTLAPGHGVSIQDIRGDFCDGRMTGFARASGEPTEYEISLSLQNLDLAQFLQRSGSRRGTSSGRLDGNLFVRGFSNRPASRTGGGDFRVRGLTPISVPVVRSIFEAGEQRGLGDEVDQVELECSFEGFDMRIERVEITSRDLRLVGEGRWDMQSDRIALTLVGAHPRNWPRIAVLSDVLEVAGKEMILYRVEGSSEAPRVSLEPLHAISDPLRRLLAGGR